MSGKIILLIVMCMVASLAFFGAGFYFLFQKDEAIKKCGYLANAIGGVTMVLGMLIIVFPGMAALLALVYMLVLILAFIVLYFMFIKKKN